MLKKYFIFQTILCTIFLVGCTQNNEEIPDDINEIKADDIITMDELDDYMFRDDVQYVDLRNYQASFRSGFIYSFELIPFFDYLDYRAFDRQNLYDFEESEILDEQLLSDLFDKDKAIFLFADGCIRSGYLKEVLNHMGYERVFVLGGFYEYEGTHKVFGDGEFTIGDTFYTSYYDEDKELTYHMYGNYVMNYSITNIRIDIIDKNNISLRSPDYDELVNYNEQLTILENHILNTVLNFPMFKQMYVDTPIDEQVEITGFSLGFDEGILALFSSLNPQE